MSRGEETEEPITGGDSAVPGPPLDLGKPEPSGQAPESPPRFAVIISGDGSAAIDGEPVPKAEGKTVDAAVLDVLHGYARDLDTMVTATISDPSAGYVAFVEVAPDGSSTLLDQQEPTPVAAPAPVPVPAYPEAPSAPLPPPPPPPNAPSTSYQDPDPDEDDYDDAEAEAEAEEGEETAFGADPGTGPGGAYGVPTDRPAPQLVRTPGARQSDDEYQGPGLLHSPLVVGPVALVAAALVIVPLVILGSGGSDDGEHRKETARSSDETEKSPQAEKSGPISTPPPSRPTPRVSASASPSAKLEKPKKPKETKKPEDSGNGGGVVVTITARPPQATVTAKPPQDTAAGAVRRLAKNDPSGRHICYRAYVSGQGWQKPVCDGTMAGTTNQNRPIKALNIAVSGGAGSAANAFVHNPASKDGRGKWMPSWTAVKTDGTNNYIGSTKQGAPNMSGFAINIGKGRICQQAKVGSSDWGGQGCANARPAYIFGGALQNDRYLEAVKFTV